MSDLIFNDFKILQKKISKDIFIKAIVNLIKPVSYKNISEWPAYFTKEGIEIAQNNYVNALKLLKIISDSNLITEEIVKSDFLTNIKNSFSYIPTSEYKYPVGVIHNLISGGKNNHSVEELVNQYSSEYFSHYENLKFITTYNLFDFYSSQREMIIEILIFLSSLCRKSAVVYPAINQLNIYSTLYKLIKNCDSAVKSKICNLIGNMCRHSDYFYESIKNSKYYYCRKHNNTGCSYCIRKINKQPRIQ